MTKPFPFKINLATQIRVEAAKARLAMGEAKYIKTNDGDVYLEAIQDKDGVVILDHDYRSNYLGVENARAKI